MLYKQTRGSYMSKAPGEHVVLFSGGLDSTATAVKLMTQDIKPKLLFMDTGAQDIAVSLEAAKVISAELGLELIVDTTLKVYGERTAIGREVYIPRRNILFAMIGATYGNHVYIGGIKGDFTHDKTPQVFAETKKLLNLSGNDQEKMVFLDSILWDLNKIEVAQLLIDAGHGELVKTCIGCYSGQEQHCGDCIACMRKYAMMTYLDIDTDGIFMVYPPNSEGAAYYKELIEGRAYFENIPENIMRATLGLKRVDGGDIVKEFEEKQAIEDTIN